jgi:protein-disulfide isomerase
MASTDRAPMVEPLDEHIDHVRRKADAPAILEYGDYEWLYSREAVWSIHAHALAAAAEAAARQGRFWEMHELLFHRQKALEDDDLRSYANEIGLALARFDRDRVDADVRARIARDVTSGEGSGVVRGTPTLFIDGVLHEGAYDTAALIEALAR